MNLPNVRGACVRAMPTAAAALLWALAAGSAAWWSLQWPRSEDALATVAAAPMALPQLDPGGVARALGHVAGAVADEPSRFQLLGVIAGPAGQGSALLGVDAQPARAFVQGQAVVEGWRLQSVSRVGVRLSADSTGGVLELPLPGMDSRSSRE